jgi:hypothetical protein
MECRREGGIPDPPPAPWNVCQIEGEGTWNGDPVLFRVTVKDLGEPGIDDFYSIVVLTPALGFVYFVGGTLAHGNVQILAP